ncbi:hypothetical protein TM239_02220 [Bradyrhizobium sp. TM239]|nr:hypothetical protein TM239_02220 [Bradyrhizobium sp. TM239]
MPRSVGSWRRVWCLAPVLSRLLDDIAFTAICFLEQMALELEELDATATENQLAA